MINCCCSSASGSNGVAGSGSAVNQRLPAVSPGGEDGKQIRFAVRSLGWVGIEEEDLTPERSSKAVNRCIVDLSLGRNDINDVVGRWGDVSETLGVIQNI